MKQNFSIACNSDVYKFLTRGHHLKNLANVNFLFKNEENLEVFLEHPELSFDIVKKFFTNFIVIQHGKQVKNLGELNVHIEALILLPHKDGLKYDLFLARAS